MSTSKTKDEKPFYFSFFNTLVTQNYNMAVNKGFHLRQAVNCSLWFFENSYRQKCIFVKDFQRQFKI